MIRQNLNYFKTDEVIVKIVKSSIKVNSNIIDY